jgi:hypothetical protein
MAPRPAFSALGSTRAALLPSLESALGRCLDARHAEGPSWAEERSAVA